MQKTALKKGLRTFGLMLSVLIVLFSYIFWRQGHFDRSRYMLISGIVIFFTSVTFPQIIVIIQKPWMWLAEIIGTIVTSLILTIIYYAFFVPYALLLKLFGMTFFKKSHSTDKSYWIDKKTLPELPVAENIRRYERQF